MFNSENCCVDNCNEPAWAESEFCLNHHPGAAVHEKNVMEDLLSGNKVLERRDFCCFDFSRINLDEFDFQYCRFTGANFKGASLKKVRFLMCTLDNVDASGCDFSESRMMSMMAAGSNFDNSNFSGSDLININFNGITALNSIFDESDLFYSRFIAADLSKASFNDCNLKRVDFTGADLTDVDFSNSNPEESYIVTGVED